MIPPILNLHPYSNPLGLLL